jgi:glycosyltransferase involved in cell wall biosynthesis
MNSVETSEVDEIERSFRYRLGDLIVRSWRSPGSLGLLPWRLARLISAARARSLSLRAVERLECGLGLSALRARADRDPAPASLARTLMRDGTLPASALAGEGWLADAAKLAAEYRDVLGGRDPDLPIADGEAGVVQAGSVLSILHSSLVDRVNGYGIRSHALLSGLMEQGWAVTAMVRLFSGGADRLDGPAYRGLGVAYEGGGLRDHIEALSRSIEQAARDSGASVLHAASNFIVGYATLLAARRLGRPFVYEVRGLWHITRASADPGFAASLSYRVQDQLESFVAREADQLVTLNQPLADYMIDRGARPDRIRLVPNGVELEAFRRLGADGGSARAELGLADQTVIGFCGSLTPYEGLERFIRAVAPILRQRDDCVLLVVGDGPSRAGLEALCQELRVGPRVIFTGRVTPDRARILTGLFNVAPFPRLATPVNRLVTPLKPIEAMAAGASVLLSNLPPLAELRGPGMPDLIQPGDARAWRKAVEDLLDDPAAMTRAGRASQSRAAELSWHASALQLGEALRFIPGAVG